MKWQSDKDWSDAYLPALRSVVGPLLLDEAPLEEDREQATDLMVLIGRDIRIGCRVRRPGYAERYPYDFTIRSSRQTGAITELPKIIGGWGDWLVYAHAAEGALPMLARWMVLDLHVFRIELANERVAIKETANGDGTYFAAFSALHFPESLIVAANPRVHRLVPA